jgi:hypothetical protein
LIDQVGCDSLGRPRRLDPAGAPGRFADAALSLVRRETLA